MSCCLELLGVGGLLVDVGVGDGTGPPGVDGPCPVILNLSLRLVFAGGELLVAWPPGFVVVSSGRGWLLSC